MLSKDTLYSCPPSFVICWTDHPTSVALTLVFKYVVCIFNTLQDVLEKVAPYVEDARLKVNAGCAQLEGWQIIAYTFGVTLILVSIYNFIFDEEKSMNNLKMFSLYYFMLCI